MAAVKSGQGDLLDHVEWSSVECLNEKPNKTWANALKQGYREDELLLLESDDDEQLLLYIPFNQVVKLHSLAIRAPSDGSGPKKIKIFANRPSMGFSEAADFPGLQEIELSESDITGEQPILLKYVKFQSVHSLTIFVVDNQGGEEVTRISKVQLFGTTVETTNMAELKKVEPQA